MVLVLDGVSGLSDPQWATDLDFVARHAGRLLRLVLVGRWDPPLPMHRYRLAGRLDRGPQRRPRVHPGGGRRAARHARHRPEPAGLTSLLEHTEGWAAGLRLFALALQDRSDAETGRHDHRRGGDHRRVLHRRGAPDAAAEVRGFLLDTSILDTFTPDLAQALTGRADAAQILAELERENAFVRPMGERPPAYRYHRLFAELLRARLPARTADGSRGCTAARRSGSRENGQVVDAVTHAGPGR